MADDAVADRRQRAESGSVRGHAADGPLHPAGSGLRAQQRKFNRFWEEFNTERPHEALDMRTPAQLCSGSTRPMPDRLPAFEYPDRLEVRYVSANSGIRW